MHYLKTKDQIKEEIGLEKLLPTISAVIINSLLGWTWGSKNDLSTMSLLTFYFLCIVCTVFAAVSFVKIKLKIKDLNAHE